MKQEKAKIWSTIFAVLFFLVFYLPLVSLIVFSFNNIKSVTNFGGFSLKWYKNLFTNKQIIRIVLSTLYIAIVSTLASLVIGTLASIGLAKCNRKFRDRILRINNIPITNPDIVIGIGLLLLFVSIGVVRGYGTMLLAHISFCTPYVIVTVYPKVKSLDPNLVEAAMDLGAKPGYAIYSAILPQIKTSIFAAASIAFTMSFDDFVISYFTGGKSMNISTYLYTTAKKLNPTFNALSTIIILVIVAKIIFDKVRESRVDSQPDEIIIKPTRGVYKKIGILFMLLVLIITPFFLFKNSGKTLYVFLPGEYIDNDPVDGVDLVSEFERKFKCNVEISTFESNEAAITKLETENYDVIIPSDYAIEQLVFEDYLAPIDWSRIDISSSDLTDSLKVMLDKEYTGDYKMLDYAVPYFFGSVGIVYNKDKISSSKLEAKGWDIFLDSEYKNKTAFYDSSRDAYMVALKALGYSMNTSNQDELDKATAWLKNMKQALNPSFKTDELLDEMPQGQWDLTYMYSGDATYVMMLAKEAGINLGYYVPESGTNVYCDAMCIAKNCSNEELAYEFINFMTSYDSAYANTEYVCYTTPIKEVYNDCISADGSFFEYNESYKVNQNVNDEMYRYLPEVKRYQVSKYAELKM